MKVPLYVSAVLLAITGCGGGKAPAHSSAPRPSAPPAPVLAAQPDDAPVRAAKEAVLKYAEIQEHLKRLPPEQRREAAALEEAAALQMAAVVARLTPEQQEQLKRELVRDGRFAEQLAQGAGSGGIRDRDGDGSNDDVDQCPDQPEDADAFQDEDGCPDPDNDRDGVLDIHDKCPVEAEDKDGIEDEDGCPELKAASGGRVVASGSQSDWVVAVMDLETTGAAQLSAAMLRGFTDQLRVFLGVRRIKVVDRGAQEQAMRDVVKTEKVKSYSECVDESCQIPLGKALAASHILRSSLGKFGTLCTLNGELIDLRTEVTVAAATQRASGCADDQLLDAAEKLTDGLIAESQRR